MTGAPPRAGCASVGYVPEDRQQDGLVGPFPVRRTLCWTLRPAAVRVRAALNLDAIGNTAEPRVAEFDIRPTRSGPAGTLSGGNQQKVILAREVGRDVKLLIASQPTRGVDVGAMEFIHRRIIEERDRARRRARLLRAGRGHALSDRIAVMYGGRFAGSGSPTSRRGAGPADGRHRRDRDARAGGKRFSRTARFSGGAGFSGKACWNLTPVEAPCQRAARFSRTARFPRAECAGSRRARGGRSARGARRAPGIAGPAGPPATIPP